METHPDRNGGSHEAFLEVQRAYTEILEHRAKMDNVDIFADIFVDVARKKELS